MTETVGADEDNSNNDSINDKDNEDSRNSDESRDSHDSFDIDDDVIRKIGGNDYKMSKLTIGEGDYLPDDENWEVFGRAIGKNSQIREVAFYDCHEYFIRQEDLLTFLPGFSMNRSIRQLRLAGLDLNDKVTGHPSEELLNMFAQFFNDSKAFECLELDEERDNNLYAIASLLQRFDTLKDFEVTNQNAWPGEPCRYIRNVDFILEALTGHTGLRNLAIADAKIGEGGGNALAMILQNPTIILTSLTLNATEMYESGKPYRDIDYTIIVTSTVTTRVTRKKMLMMRQ
jgi:hypothetical protein